MPTGALTLAAMMTLANAGDSIPLLPRPQDWAHLYGRKWGDNLTEISRHPEVPRELRTTLQDLVAAKHADPGVRSAAMPIIQLAIINLADDHVKWNAFGAKRFLRLAGDLARPLLEVAMVTGDEQQRMVATELLAYCPSVTDRRALATQWVWLLRDGGHGLAGPTGMVAFRWLSCSDQLLQEAIPALEEALRSPDLQLRINAAQLLCLAGVDRHADRIVEILAPLLDDDQASGTARSAMCALGYLDVAAIGPIRERMNERDSQGQRLSAHLIAVMAGPYTEGAHEMDAMECREVTIQSRDPARDPSMLNFIAVMDGKVKWGDGPTGWYPMWAHRAIRHGHGQCPELMEGLEFDSLEWNAAHSARLILLGSTERVARRAMEYDRWRSRQDGKIPGELAKALPMAFEAHLTQCGADPVDPPAFRDAGSVMSMPLR